MFKKAVSMMLAAAVVCSMTACGGNKEAETATTQKADGLGTESGIAEVKWPKNVEIIVPAGAGGDTDFNARLLAQKLSDKLPAKLHPFSPAGNWNSSRNRRRHLKYCGI